MKSRLATKPRVMGALLLLAGAVLVGSCSGGAGGSVAGGADGAGGAVAKDVAGEVAAGPQRRAQPAGPVLAPRDRAVVYTADLKLRVSRVAAARRSAVALVSGAGGYVSGEHTSRDPDADRARTRLTLKVPVGRYPAVLHRLSADLGSVLDLQQRAQDVTEQVADVDSRVRSARATLARLRALLDRADTVKQVLSVEQEISNRQAELEALQARQKALDSQTSYATITLHLQGPAPATHVERAGFVSGLLAGWAALRATGQWLLTALGVAAPFLVVLGALAYGGWRGRRFLRRRRPPTARPPTTPPAAESTP